VHDGHAWTVEKDTSTALDCPRFHEASQRLGGRLLVAHIRRGTVGKRSLLNTHPFVRGAWVFAHNGTIEDKGFLESRASATRLAEVEGETDSELLFAYLLTAIDRASVADRDHALAEAVAAITQIRSRDEAACNFLLSDGHTLYAHRYGRTLYVLEQASAGSPPAAAEGRDDHACVERASGRRGRAVWVASERIGHAPWKPVPEPGLLRIDGGPEPMLRELA
jgi:glutamine amidotransferase